MPQVELQSILTNDNKQFMSAMDQAEARGKKAGKGIEQGFAGVGKGLSGVGDKFVAALSVGAIASFGKQILQLGGSLQDASDKLNINVESLQRLEFAFSQSGVTSQDFEKGMVKLNQSLDDARNGGEKSIVAFEKLGVRFSDVRDKSPEEVLALIADGMKNTTDYTESLSAATDVLGKQGPKMAAGLRQGAAAIKELGEQASILTTKDIAQLDEAGDAWDKFGKKLLVLGARATLTFAQLEKLRTSPAAFIREMAAERSLPVARSSSPMVAPETKGGEADPIFTSVLPGSAERAREIMRKRMAEQEEKAAKENADFIDKDLQNRQERFLEILSINEDIAAVNDETARQAMDGGQMIVEMEKQRVAWLAKAVKFENDIFNLHEKDAALARLRAAKLAQQIAEAKRNAPKTFAQSVFDDKGRSMMDRMKAQAGFSTFTDAGNRAASPVRSHPRGGLVTGGLQSGGLIGGGLGDAYHKIRNGDAARRKAAANEAKKEKDPMLLVAQNTAALAEKWGAPAVRP